MERRPIRRSSHILVEGQTSTDAIYTADALFRGLEGEDAIVIAHVGGRYADLKQASADRCPRLLGTFVKSPEVQYHHDVYNQYLWNKF